MSELLAVTVMILIGTTAALPTVSTRMETLPGAKTTEHGPLPSPAVDHLLSVLNHENLVENLVELESTLSNEAKDSLPAIAIFGGLIGVFAIVAAFLLYRRHRTARELEAKYEPLDKKPVTRSSAPPPRSLVDSPTGDTHRISLPAAHVQLHAHAHAHRSSAASGMTLEHEPKPTEPKPDQAATSIPQTQPHDVPPSDDHDDEPNLPGLGKRHAHKHLKPVTLPLDKPPPVRSLTADTPRKGMRHVAGDAKYLTEHEKSAISVAVDKSHESIVQQIGDVDSLQPLLPRTPSGPQSHSLSTPRSNFVRQHTGLNTPRSPTVLQVKRTISDPARPQNITGSTVSTGQSQAQAEHGSAEPQSPHSTVTVTESAAADLLE